MITELKDVTPDLDKIRELALKIKELATRGEENERDVAHNKLEALLKKYGLSFQEIIETESFKRIFQVENTTDCVDILSQCIWDVNPDAPVSQIVTKKQVLVSLTSSQFIEVTEKFKYFWTLYVKQRDKYIKQAKDNFLVGFIVKNKLGIENDSNKEEMSQDQIDKVVDVAGDIEKGDFKIQWDQIQSDDDSDMFNPDGTPKR